MELFPESREYEAPERRLPDFTPGKEDIAFLQLLDQGLEAEGQDGPTAAEVDSLFAKTRFPKRFEQLMLVLYAPGQKRIMVSRAGRKGGQIAFSEVWLRLIAHGRRPSLTASPYCRLQMDFVVEPPMPVDFYKIGMELEGERHFEIGVDGLLFKGGDGVQKIFLPGDGYVRSVMSMGQLREYMHRAYSEEALRASVFERFRSESFLSGANTWLRLYRGHPLVGTVSKGKIEHALVLAIGHIRLTQKADGMFLYYYDAARDSYLDHEHPSRDPEKNPYYNILRHCGGGLTCVFYEKYTQCGQTIDNIRRSVEYLVSLARPQNYEGREGAYIYSERKSKLGGAGVALYLVAEHQLLTGDTSFQGLADRLAWHLVNQITATGEFIYYNVYLDQPIAEADNHLYFSFYYPGEAVCGLAKYLHLIDGPSREPIFAKLRQALEFLLVVRPTLRANEYTQVPSDSWLMMGIKELWDFAEMRDPSYAAFVFQDAQAMIDHLYKVTDAPYPDYAGAFYYNYGDYPYADGARCEGLLGAYELAVKMGDTGKACYLWRALRLAAWALLHLVNTEESVYFTPKPTLALGGIRFKYTRQWFRIDTIQHVASFFGKMLPYWERAESEAEARQAAGIPVERLVAERRA